jgi:glycosyltransferase involved in cell wall biosynthesis
MTGARTQVSWICLEWPRAGLHSGGVGRYSYRLAELIADEVDLTVFVRSGAIPLKGVRLIELSASRSRVFRYYVDPLRLPRALARVPADLVHAFGDDWAVGGRRKVRTFLGSAREEAKSSQGARAVNHYLIAITEWIVARRSQVRIGIAAESATRFNAHHVMPPILDTMPQFPRRKTSTPSVMFIGTFAGRKRGWLVQRLVEEAQRELATPIRLTVICPAQDAEQWASWVQVHVGLDDTSVALMLASTWVLCAPSMYEGFGIPAFEALAAGVSVVTTATPGSTYLQGGVLPNQAIRICETDADLKPALMSALQDLGEWDDATRTSVEDRLVHLRELGSPSRLLNIYREVLLLDP